MKPQNKIAIIGSGASTIFVLKHVHDHLQQLGRYIAEIHVFERDSVMGTGMPYSRRTTDQYNLCNISSAEIPALCQSLVQWLTSLDDTTLAQHGISRSDIDAGESYSRLLMGEYFQAQYRGLVDALRHAGIAVTEHADCQVNDVVDLPDANLVEIIPANGGSISVDHVIIATGHAFNDDDDPESGYFASPWPMQKLLPKPGSVHNFTVGTLGASLSAYDVVSSLSHRTANLNVWVIGLSFTRMQTLRTFALCCIQPTAGCHICNTNKRNHFVRFIDTQPVSRCLDYAMRNGHLSLNDYFDKVCRPALSGAFAKDDRADIVERLGDPAFSLTQFVELMTSEHEYDEPFCGMNAEMVEAEHSIRRGKPIHWKEVLDDLMFTLNFHFEWLYAEDVLIYRKTVVPFLMNVIAAMPLESAKSLLALYEAGRLELAPGRVTVREKALGKTTIEVDYRGQVSHSTYQMFVDCTAKVQWKSIDFRFRT